jgi:hypothetical protein
MGSEPAAVDRWSGPSGRGPTAFLAGIFRSYRAREGTQPFVILFVPRTGSNYLAALLDTHPGRTTL